MTAPFDLRPDEWTSLRELLQTAIDLDPASRADWLDRLGEEHASLKPQLEALLALAADGSALARLEAPPKVETAQFLPPLPVRESAQKHGGHEVPERIGPYRLIRELGEGGMGSVWLAERVDMLQRRPVALKLPRIAWPAAGFAERLEREREILATLDHPNIARLYDAGVADDGQPYLALEYVEGERIDRYCARKGLDVRARLELLLQVARAVAHAHANLIVHRDLKPANILVTEAGAVRLLDFGIAKLLEDGATRETELTRLAGRALTPDYAAPEQILGQPIGTAADVYALGVLLFELLTGTRPYQLKRDSRAALEEAILEAEIPRPSGVAASPKLRKALRGDLDSIVAKALKKQPSQRYGTAAALADDIERHLRGQPVLAQPDRLGYRLGKFVARNRLGVATAAAVTLAVLAGASAALWQAGVARAEQRRAEDVKKFIASIFRDASPWIGPQQTPSAVELLQRARSRIDQATFAETVTRVDLLNTLGESFLGMQANAQALEAADAAVKVSVEALGERHPQTVRARSLRFQALRNHGHTAEMRGELEAMLAVVSAHPERQPETMVRVLNDKAELELDEGKYAEAEVSAREALALSERHAGDWTSVRISLWKAIAASYESRTMYGEAVDAAAQSYRHALAFYEGKAMHPHLVNMRLIYARALSSVDDYARAIPLIEQSITDSAELFGPDSRPVGQYAQNLAVVAARVGDLRKARANLDRALAIVAKHYGTDSAHYGAVLDAAGFIALSSRRPAEAIGHYDRALAIVHRHYGPEIEHAFTIRMRRALAVAYAGTPEKALPELEAVADGYRTRGFAGMSRPLAALGEATRLAGRYEQALALQRSALAAVRAGASADRDRMPILAEIGINLVELGRFAEALPVLRQATQLFDTKLVDGTPQQADALMALGRAHLGQGEPRAALAALERADALWRALGPDTRWAGEVAFWLAAIARAR